MRLSLRTEAVRLGDRLFRLTELTGGQSEELLRMLQDLREGADGLELWRYLLTPLDEMGPVKGPWVSQNLSGRIAEQVLGWQAALNEVPPEEENSGGTSSTGMEGRAPFVSWVHLCRWIGRAFSQDPLQVWATWSKRQLLEHYQDAIRQRRADWVVTQGFHQGRFFKEESWAWLERLEEQRWGGQGGQPAAPRLTQRELHEAKARRMAVANTNGSSS